MYRISTNLYRNKNHINSSQTEIAYISVNLTAFFGLIGYHQSDKEYNSIETVIGKLKSQDV
jgi:hypothetical protein